MPAARLVRGLVPVPVPVQLYVNGAVPPEIARLIPPSLIPQVALVTVGVIVMFVPALPTVTSQKHNGAGPSMG